MNLEYKYLLNGSFDPHSRIWIYQSSRIFTIDEALDLEDKLNEFAADWKSHGTPVKGAGYLFFGQFIILMADETATGVSGCSTDSSVRFIKQLEQEYQVNLFDRTMLSFVVKDKIQQLPLAQLSYAFQNGFLTEDSLYFNNTVQTKEELENNWIIPVRDSWLAKRLPAGV
jgi:hypothetical protein